MSNIKNYSLQGGEKWVVEGELEFAEEGKLTFQGSELKPAAGQADSEASSVATLKNDFNALLQKLFGAGLMVVDKSELMTAIAEALGLLEGAVVGYGIGEYYQDDYDTFQGAIAAAQEVAEETEASQNEMAAALGTLASAKTAFESAASAVDKTFLAAALAEARVLLGEAVVGYGIGEYYEDDHDDFSAAIAAVELVLEGKSVSQGDVGEALTVLEAAVSAFEAAASTVDKTSLAAVIADAQDLLDASEVGSDPGQYPQEACSAFETAIEGAEDVITNKSATQSAVDTAVSTLETAMATFEAAANPGT